jgi:hypothetical protein
MSKLQQISVMALVALVLALAAVVGAGIFIGDDGSPAAGILMGDDGTPVAGVVISS